MKKRSVQRSKGIVLGLMFVMSIHLQAQYYPIPKGSKMDTLQGIWIEEWFELPNDGRIYELTINKENKSLYFIEHKNGKINKSLTIEGFQDSYKDVSVFYDDKTNNEVLDLNLLKADGKYYTLLFESDINPKLKIGKRPFMPRFTLNSKNSYTTGHGKTETVRVAKPPYNVKHLTPLQWNGIFSLSQKDQRDYIAEFLELDVRHVKGDREPLYSDPYTVVDRLSKGTIVRVLGSEQKSGHVQIEYYNTENKVDTGLVIGSFLSTAIQDENGFDKPVASFDCQKSKSVVEQLICSDHHLGLLDIWLNDAYKQAKFFRPKELKSSQRAWIKERNRSITKEQLPHQQRAILEKLYRERIAFLKEWE